MTGWLLIVLFTTTDDAKVAVFKTQKECEISKGVTVSVIGKHPDVKSIECVQGTLKGSGK
jgi:hypothetical protein